MAAAISMLDERHAHLPQHPADKNNFPLFPNEQLSLRYGYTGHSSPTAMNIEGFCEVKLQCPPSPQGEQKDSIIGPK
jgi:hypothetical protein